MRVTILASVLGMVLAAGATAQAQTPPEGLAWMVLRDINETTFDRDDPTNRPPLVTRVPDGVIRAVDLTPDGHADWRVDYGPAEISAYCGTGGCTQILYVSLGDDGLTRAFDEQAHELTLYQQDGERRVEAWVHHSLCSSDAGRECRFSYAWDADLRRLVERPNREGVTVIPVGAFSPIDRSEDRGPRDDAPQPVADIWFKTRTTCASVYNDDGIDVRRPALHDIPDVDGDGRRDWVVERTIPCQASPGDMAVIPGFEVWLTRDDGQAVLAYGSQAERFARIDVAATPAVVIDEPECDNDGSCASILLKWDAGAQRLTP